MGDSRNHARLEYASPGAGEPVPPWKDLAKAVAVLVAVVAGIPAGVIVFCYIWKVFNC